MSKSILIASGIGILCVVIAVAMIFHVQRGAHMELTGHVLKVRTAPLDEQSSVAAVDFRVTNPADYAFVVKNVTLIMVDAKGNQTEGDSISETDAQRMFEGIPLLGPKYNSGLLTRESIAPHATVDRMISARFEVPDATLQGRKNLILRIDDLEGRSVNEFPEK